MTTFSDAYTQVCERSLLQQMQEERYKASTTDEMLLYLQHLASLIYSGALPRRAMHFEVVNVKHEAEVTSDPRLELVSRGVRLVRPDLTLDQARALIGILNSCATVREDVADVLVRLRIHCLRLYVSKWMDGSCTELPPADFTNWIRILQHEKVLGPYDDQLAEGLVDMIHHRPHAAAAHFKYVRDKGQTLPSRYTQLLDQVEQGCWNDFMDRSESATGSKTNTTTIQGMRHEGNPLYRIGIDPRTVCKVTIKP